MPNDPVDPVETKVVKPRRRERIASDLAVLRSAGFSLVIILGVMAIATVTARDLTQAPVVLEEIVVTEDFKKDGLNGLVVSNMLWDEIENVRNYTGKQNKKTVRIQTASRQLDVVAPGSGLSLQRVTQVLRSLFNLPQTRIAGEIACPVRHCEAGEMTLTLRIFSGSGTSIIEAMPIGDSTMREYMQETALQLMEEEIDPLGAAWFHYYEFTDEGIARARLLATKTMIARVPKSEEAMVLLGYIDLDQGAYDEAMIRALDAIALGDDIRRDRTLWERLTSVFYDDGRDAIRAESYYLHAIAQQSKGQNKMALANFETAQSFAPEFARIKADHAASLLALEDFQGAVDLLNTALEQDPSDVFSWVQLGEALDELGLPEEADAKIALAEVLVGDDPWFKYYSHIWSVEEALSEAENWATGSPGDEGAWDFWSEVLVDKSYNDFYSVCDRSQGLMADYLGVVQAYAPYEFRDYYVNVAKEECNWTQ